ncbi:cell division protein FtsZ [Pseudokordiimonas caeni]|uniref:cell division protein FtsZ n=1 Tax=Pseudokordiimonas caeni TaxID=2997908 RepID=UPI00281275FE|nr:cell division protein FtsZ [Pseudokordiimonas caeni]
MSIEFENMELTELTPRILVIGVGGAGCNAVNNMIAAQLQGVDFVVANTDAQALASSLADNRVQLGAQITQGLGAGAQPKVGESAAEESIEAIDRILDGCHMAFITAGMGGGTGTGAAPVIARRARERGILTVGVVTRPFHFEGGRRMKIADAGIAALSSHVDTLIIIPNQNLFRVANERTTFADAFNMADEVLHSGVRGITDLMVMPGLINLDFADVRTVMSEMGKAMMGTGEADGEERAMAAAEAAIANPLLEDASLKGAKGVIINVTGGMDMTLYEVDAAVNMVREQVDPDALIVFGSAFNPELDGRIRVSVVATGIEGGAIDLPVPSRATIAARVATPVVEPVKEEAPAVQEEVAVEEPVADEKSDEFAEAVLEESLIVGGSMGTSEFAENHAGEETSEEEFAEDDTDDIEARALAAKEDEGFVAEAPMMPKARQTAYRAADVVQEEAYTRGTTEAPRREAEPIQPGGAAPAAAPRRSLFQLMTSGFRSNEEAGAPTPVVEPSNDEARRRTSLGGVSAEDRPAPSSEQLEIPSFLRRQQN